ncbi:hypothetical protein [Aliamphritea spongicola]|uniref:hypothetical protein n=1 Tax=Aliamphritea spongicola TaxID=707589 RepID=UPI00196B83D6|nr:hypothetical protein [Aliamphritea spongicola]MBN3562473.1 hypothetical protein [Aliamphritea spongicola]
MNIRTTQQGAVLFTLLLFLPVIGWLSSISWQSIQLHLDANDRHSEQQRLITQAQQALFRVEDILKTEYLRPFDRHCNAGRCSAMLTPDESSFLILRNGQNPVTTQRYLLEKNQQRNLINNETSTRYKIHILITHADTQQKIHLSAMYKISQGAAIRQSWLLEKGI